VLLSAVVAAAYIGSRDAAADPAQDSPRVSLDAATTMSDAARAAEALRDRYAALRAQLEQSPFQRPLYLESATGREVSQGDVYARTDHLFATVSSSLTNPDNWCEVLLLHVNVKGCSTGTQGDHDVLRVAMGQKLDQAPEKTYDVDFTWSVTSSESGYVEAVLYAADGPFGTRDYRIALQAVAIEDGQTFLHLQYSVVYGRQARLAMGIYLATVGSHKVGFTMVTTSEDRPPQPVRGIRGAVERNVMRYYLAVDAYLAALSAPEPDRFEQSLGLWFDATEAYARQLHEMDRDTYLAMKRQERRRQPASGQEVPE
jgi:hypothetical protein